MSGAWQEKNFNGVESVTMYRIPVVLLLFILATIACTQAPDKPEKTGVCQLLADPKAWNHKLVEVTGFASHGFEDSGFSDPSCGGRYGGLWMEFGGKKATGTMSTVSSLARERPEAAVVEGIPVPLVEDEIFRRFDELLHEGSGSLVHATVIARFFAGKENYMGSKGRWGGYGHLGCCSLFLIQQVKTLDEQRPNDLDYGEEPTRPEASCFKYLTAIDNTGDQLESQRAADAGKRAFAFDDPDRVAREEVAMWGRVNNASDVRLKRISALPGRVVYRASVEDHTGVYTVTLTRPYWISFYAANREKVAWSVLATFVTCDAKVNRKVGTETQLK
jgi:hypothetical protein